MKPPSAKRWIWSRRSLLRAGGLALALPPLEALLGARRAHGAATGADVLVAFHFPDGVYLHDWMTLTTTPRHTPRRTCP